MQLIFKETLLPLFKETKTFNSEAVDYYNAVVGVVSKKNLTLVLDDGVSATVQLVTEKGDEALKVGDTIYIDAHGKVVAVAPLVIPEATTAGRASPSAANKQQCC